MKNIFLILTLVITTFSFAQTPEKMSYQAIVRNGDGNLLSNEAVGMQISILKSSTSGTIMYAETHATTTNANGLVTIEIGSGIAVAGSFSGIDWGSDTYFIKTETDPTGGANYIISGVSQLLSVPYALHAKTAENVKKYKIGDFAQGGVVFWLDETGQHGLVCSKLNQSTSIKWFSGDFGDTRAKGNGLYAGKSNNTIIISAHNVISNNEEAYAARLCNELAVEENSIIYGDWYLASKYELRLMNENRSIINTVSTANGGDLLINDVYWSSTEKSNNRAWVFNFANGQQTDVLKSVFNRVRAIRSF